MAYSGPSRSTGLGNPPSVVASSAGARSVQVKLSDFGLARHTEETESLLVTQTGAILGTPLYMAPEQSMGTEAVGPAADVYSLGATLFHLLAGRPPFLGTSAFDLIAKLRSEPAPDVRTLNGAVSEGAAQVVAKALLKRPDERYGDAGEMLQDLDRLLRGEPTSLVAHPARPACDPRDLVDLPSSAGSSSRRPAALALGLEHRAAEPRPGLAGRVVPQRARSGGGRQAVRPVPDGRPGGELARASRTSGSRDSGWALSASSRRARSAGSSASSS